MGVLSDEQIISLAEKGMIRPFVRESVSEITRSRQTVSGIVRDTERVMSYGPSSYGYDARLAPEFKVFSPVHAQIIDVKNLDESVFVHVETNILILPAHSYCLARTIERFDIPRDILVLCVGKSSYARAGLFVNVTPLEPEWEGEVTLEIANLTPVPARIYANEGICQFVFFRGERACKRSYATKNKGKPSKYQNQTGIVPGRV